MGLHAAAGVYADALELAHGVVEGVDDEPVVPDQPQLRLGGARGVCVVGDLALQLAHAPLRFHGEACKFQLLLPVLQLQQRPRMALGQAALPEKGAGLHAQAQQSQPVCQRRWAHGEHGGQLLLGQAVLVQDAPAGFRLVQIVQILPLQVLDQADERAVTVVGAEHDGVRVGPSQCFQRPQPALARDQLVLACGAAAHQQRREQPEAPDGLRQLLNGGLVDALARLIGTGRDAAELNAGNATVGPARTKGKCRHARSSLSKLRCYIFSFQRNIRRSATKNAHPKIKNEHP